MFNAYKYVESSTEREYLEKLEYKFNTLSAAWLIDRNGKLTVKERHNGFREIIQKMPDCSVEERLNFKAEKSLHEKLKRIIEEEKAIIYDVERNFYNQYSYELFKNGQWQKEKKEYDNFKKCFLDAKNDAQKNDAYIKIMASKCTQDDRVIFLLISKDGELLSMFGSSFIENNLFDLWFDVPMPFKKGDIVRLCNEDMIPYENRCGPIVITSVPTNKVDNKSLDTFDMTLSGIYVDDEGVLCDEARFLCTEVEYFDDKFTEKQKRLVLFSEAVKEFT